MKKNLIIVGSRGYQFKYGGWETFVTNFVDYSNDEFNLYIPYLIQDKKNYKGNYLNNGVNVHDIYIGKLGFATMFQFTIKSIRYYLKLIRKGEIKDATVIILGCKVGPLMRFWYPMFKKYNTKVIINPDGIEWKREKWAGWIKKCFKISERDHVRYSDHVVCDSKAIKKYIDTEYKEYNKPSSFIAYGADKKLVSEKTEDLTKLMEKYNFSENKYYLSVGRFVPENNYETVIREFMKSKVKKDLVIVTNLDSNMKFYDELKEKLHFENDERIKFVGSVYDQKALKYLRENAYAYIHGHSAGGTNPSLLEALNTTKINILYNVSYNIEVGGEACFYFSKKDGSLKKEIEKCDNLTSKEIKIREKLEKDIINKKYTWEKVVNDYKKVI